MIYGNYDSRCPNCTSRIEMDPPRWISMTVCPSCNTELLVNYDFIVMDDEEEWDLHDLQILFDSIYKNSTLGLDLIDSQIYNTNDPSLQ